MTLMYVTGAPGVGKSTIQEALSQRGLEVYDLDDTKFGGPHNKASGQKVIIPDARERGEHWFDDHEWRIYRTAFITQKKKATNKDIIICGVAESDHEIIDLFDLIIYLKIDSKTLRERISSRHGNDYGKNKSELREILRRKQRLDTKYSDVKIVQIDASQSLEKTLQSILEIIEAKP